MKIALLALILLVSGCVSINTSGKVIETKSLGITKYNNNISIGYVNIKEYKYEENVDSVNSCRS